MMFSVRVRCEAEHQLQGCQQCLLISALLLGFCPPAPLWLGVSVPV